MKLLTWLYAILFFKRKGKDVYGNLYYENKKHKRYVIYKGYKEATKVPVRYEMWLRKITNIFPTNTTINIDKKIPNLTGTVNAFNPKKYNSKVKGIHDYTSWTNK